MKTDVSGGPVSGAMLAEFEAELATTRKFLERIPETALTWKPHEKSMTAGQLALHVAQVPQSVLGMALTDEAPPPNFAGGRQQPASAREVLQTLERSADFVRRTLPTLDDRRMNDTFKIVASGRTLMALPRAVFLRRILLNHWYHHRGQLGSTCGCWAPRSRRATARAATSPRLDRAGHAGRSLAANLRLAPPAIHQNERPAASRNA